MKTSLAPRAFSHAAASPEGITKSSAAPQTDGCPLLSPAAPGSQGRRTTVPQQKHNVLKLYFQALWSGDDSSGFSQLNTMFVHIYQAPKRGRLLWEDFLLGFLSPPHLCFNQGLVVISHTGALALPVLDARVLGQVLTPKSPERGGETEILDYSSSSTELVLARCGPYTLREVPFY